MLKAAHIPTRDIQTSTGIKVGIVLPYSSIQSPPAADKPNERTSAILTPVMRYQRPPNTAPMSSEAAEANAL